MMEPHEKPNPDCYNEDNVSRYILHLSLEQERLKDALLLCIEAESKAKSDLEMTKAKVRYVAGQLSSMKSILASLRP